jgi:hypothetical protein
MSGNLIRGAARELGAVAHISSESEGCPTCAKFSPERLQKAVLHFELKLAADPLLDGVSNIAKGGAQFCTNGRDCTHNYNGNQSGY